MKRLHTITIALVVLLFTMSGMAYGLGQWGEGQVNVNTASKDQLVWFLGQSGVHDAVTIADNILAYRDANGPFHDTAELRNVKGINEHIYRQILPRVKVTGETDYTADMPAPASSSQGFGMKHYR